MNDVCRKSRTARSRRAAALGNHTPQNNHLEAREERKISKTPEGWCDELLASGPDRGVHFAIELGTIITVVVRRIHKQPPTKNHERVLLIIEPEDFDWFNILLNEYYPITSESGR